MTTGGRARLDEAMAARRRTEAVARLRALARGERAPVAARDPDTEHCDLCSTTVPEDHRHMLNLAERQIVCVCESCWALRSGDADFRPVGNRTLWLPDLDLPDDVWASFQIPIGLAFFMHSSVTDCVVALYPSPAGATESELHFSTWSRARELNPVLDDLEPDIEALIVNRMADQPMYAIAPIDRCYMLVGLVKANWHGISGGPEVGAAVERFFGDLEAQAVPA
jgi:Family of unknown function (DUF5947)